MSQLLLVGEDQFFSNRELQRIHNIIHVQTQEEALALAGRIDFDAIIASNGEDMMKVVRASGKHTPFLNISESVMASDCCGGHMAPAASDTEKAEVLCGLMKRNHDTDCR